MVYMTHRADVHVRLVPHEMLLAHRPFLLSACRPAGAAHELSPERGQCDQRPEPGGARHREAPSPHGYQRRGGSASGAAGDEEDGRQRAQRSSSGAQPNPPEHASSMTSADERTQPIFDLAVAGFPGSARTARPFKELEEAPAEQVGITRPPC